MPPSTQRPQKYAEPCVPRTSLPTAPPRVRGAVFPAYLPPHSPPEGTSLHGGGQRPRGLPPSAYLPPRPPSLRVQRPRGLPPHGAPPGYAEPCVPRTLSSTAPAACVLCSACGRARGVGSRVWGEGDCTEKCRGGSRTPSFPRGLVGLYGSSAGSGARVSEWVSGVCVAMVSMSDESNEDKISLIFESVRIHS